MELNKDEMEVENKEESRRNNAGRSANNRGSVKVKVKMRWWSKTGSTTSVLGS